MVNTIETKRGLRKIEHFVYSFGVIHLSEHTKKAGLLSWLGHIWPKTTVGL